MNLQLLMLIAVAAQLPLIGLAFLLEFSRRKKRPQPRDERTTSESSPPTAVRDVSAQFAPPVPVAAPEQPVAPSEALAESGAEMPLPPPIEAPVPVAVKAAQAALSEPELLRSPAEISRPAVEPELTTAVAAPEPMPSVAVVAPRKAPARIGLGLRKTRENFLARVRAAITGSAQTNEIYESLEEALVSADVGVETSMQIVEAVRSRLKNDARADVIRDALKDEIAKLLDAAQRPIADSGDAPLVIMMAGVNGVGKTTTVAKLAALLKAERGPVIVAASDTFRAAAIDQLQVWCDRVGVDLVKQKQGSDPAAVAFDAVKAGVARKAAAVIIDTAGRLQTKVNLMEELKKISRIVGREVKGAPHETWLVLDATTGQNALSQAKLFGEAVPLTGVVLAKLDSTAKGGVIIGIAERLKLPVRFVGLGESLEDLRSFDPREFVDGLFSDAEDSSQAANGTYAA